MSKKHIVLIGIVLLLLAGAAWWQKQSHVAQDVIATAWNETCRMPSATEGRVACFKKTLTQVLGRFGTDGAFEGIAQLYDSDPEFQALCHDFTHLLGKYAYNEFSSRQEFRLSRRTAYCAFGFYHGFMETLLSSGGSLEEAQQLCVEAKKQLGEETPNVTAACYHGIGHGSVDIHNPVYAGNEYALINPALEICRRFAQDAEQLKFCGTGVFDSLSLAYYNQENGFVMRAGDPVWICREQEGVLRESCYLDMMPAMLWMGQYDLAQAAPLVARFAEQEYRPLAVKTIAEGSIRYILGKKDPTEYLAVCRGLADELQLSCVAGLGAGIMQFGKPEVEYKEALAFCDSPALNPSEADACFSSVLSYVRGRYSAVKAEQICEETNPQYRRYCVKS